MPQIQHEAQLGAAQTEEFMSVAAHDLRNPIAVVRASAQMAQRQLGRGDLDAARGRLTAIVEQTDRMTEMLETFLDAARIDAERLPLRPERLDLREVVEAAAGRARLVVGENSARTLEMDMPDRCLGFWDRPRLVRAMRSILANALMYGDPGLPVKLVARCDGTRVRLTVSGQGAGPDAEERDHLFERFYRGKSASDAGQAGSGLGLFTARGIVRGHGGDLRHLHGDTFEIELPLANEPGD